MSFFRCLCQYYLPLSSCDILCFQSHILHIFINTLHPCLSSAASVNIIFRYHHVTSSAFNLLSFLSLYTSSLILHITIYSSTKFLLITFPSLHFFNSPPHLLQNLLSTFTKLNY